MPIIINNEEFSGAFSTKKIERIILALENLTPTEVLEDEATVYNEDETGVVLQREFIHTHHQALRNLHYLLTTNVGSCIVVYVRSDSDHLMIHFDDTHNINLAELLVNFRSLANLTVTLIGGNLTPKAKTNLFAVLSLLYDAADGLNLAITLSSQYLSLKPVSCKKMANIAIDLSTGMILPVTTAITVRHYAARQVVLMDPYKIPTYFSCYDAERDLHLTPTLSPEFLRQCLAAKLVENDSEKFNAVFFQIYKRQLPASYINLLKEFIVTLERPVDRLGLFAETPTTRDQTEATQSASLKS